MKLPLLLLTFTLLSTLQLTFSRGFEPLKGKWAFALVTKGPTDVCCPFGSLTFKSDPNSAREDMIGTFSFASEYESRCVSTRFENYTSKGFELSVSGRRDDGRTYIQYEYLYSYSYLDQNYSYWRTDSLSVNFKTDYNKPEILTVDYTDRNNGEYTGCEYTMTKVEASADFLSFWEEAASWKIGLAVFVIFAGLCLACQGNKYKVVAMEVEEDGVQKYQSPQAFPQQADTYYNQNMNC